MSVIARQDQIKNNGNRFRTRVIHIGDLKIGGDHPLVIQSMTTSDTMEIDQTVAQTKQLADIGCEMVRITAPTVQDAEALKTIRDRLRADGYKIPLVADIHFLPAAAMIAADYVEKVRINPGNYADRKLFKTREYSDSEYHEELERIHEKFKPLVLKLKSLDRALRIGTNHGSLSDRIMNRFGDTPEGMVESSFEFAEICRRYDFHNFCFSMKASNVGVMTKAYRLLVEKQRERNWDYPIHLGVTEAGDGEDARIKSAIGIGTLLAEGIGDTIRVSLTEASVKEIPVAKAIAAKFPRDQELRSIGYSTVEDSKPVPSSVPEVWMRWNGLENLKQNLKQTDLRPDTIYMESLGEDLDEIHFLKTQLKVLWGKVIPKLAVKEDSSWTSDEKTRRRVVSAADYIIKSANSDLKGDPIFFVESIETLKSLENIQPSQIVFNWKASGESLDRVINASLEAGSAFVDLPLKAIMIDGLDSEEALRLSFGILQATRRRMSKTEYISCPSCGRTLFDLEETTAKIKSVTQHLKGVKIAIMGCIVNGPGEMADADFGYVGGAPGRVNLYVGKDCVDRNIISAEAPSKLIELIKTNGKWMEPASL
ncbi:MAG: ispG [Bacteriovoracaceae bacterium]|nr:ispG [Bacteriovoracaceae bacterium]